MDKIKIYTRKCVYDIDTYLGIILFLCILGLTHNLGKFITNVVNNDVFISATSGVAIKLIFKNSNNGQ